MNADLHCHSTVSDGTLEPEALAARAKANGVELWALTDHDELGGQRRARDAARAAGLPYLTGVEISVTFAGTTVHIVGLGIDSDDARAGGRAWPRPAAAARRARARWPTTLAKVGIPGAYEGALRYVGNPELISRTHFARHLVESGVCADTQEVFRRFLVEGKPGFVPHRWATLQRRGALDRRRRRHRRDRPPGALQVHADRGVRALHRVQGARRARRRGRDRQPQRGRGRALRRARRASSTCSPRAAATSTAPTKAGSTSAACRRCRRT